MLELKSIFSSCFYRSSNLNFQLVTLSHPIWIGILSRRIYDKPATAVITIAKNFLSVFFLFYFFCLFLVILDSYKLLKFKSILKTLFIGCLVALFMLCDKQNPFQFFWTSIHYYLLLCSIYWRIFKSTFSNLSYKEKENRFPRWCRNFMALRLVQVLPLWKTSTIFIIS